MMVGISRHSPWYCKLLSHHNHADLFCLDHRIPAALFAITLFHTPIEKTLAYYY